MKSQFRSQAAYTAKRVRAALEQGRSVLTDTGLSVTDIRCDPARPTQLVIRLAGLDTWHDTTPEALFIQAVAAPMQAITRW